MRISSTVLRSDGDNVSLPPAAGKEKKSVFPGASGVEPPRLSAEKERCILAVFCSMVDQFFLSNEQFQENPSPFLKQDTIVFS